MPVNKVIYDNETLIDISDSTVTSETLLKGIVAYDKSGNKITGSLDVPKYILLEYIESDGEQYIDTGFMPNQNTRVNIKYQTTTTSSACVFGVDNGWCSSAFAMFTNVVEYGTKSASATLYGSSAITASLNKNVLSKNGSTLNTFTSSTFQSTGNLALFGLNRWGEVVEMTAMTFYSCQIYDNGTLVRDFIPCIDVASGEVGLWDLVEDKFYGNSGTGIFTGTTLSE